MLKKDLEFLKKVDYTPNLKKKYTYIEGDFHKVIFSHEKRSKEIVLKLIKNYPGIKWKLIRFALIMNFYKFIRWKNSIGFLRLRVDSLLNYPGEVILIDNRKKVLDLKNRKIYYTMNRKSQLLEEITLRKKFPGINFAPLVKKDLRKKVLIMQFLDLKMFNNLLKTPFKIVQNSFDQLIYFYKKNHVKKKDFGKEMVKLWERNNNFKSLDKKSWEKLNSACAILKNRKKFISIKAHRDFHLAHIGKNNENNKIYILDWEKPKEENLLFDLFWMILVDYRINKGKLLKYIIYKGELNKTLFKGIIPKFEKEFQEDLNSGTVLSYFMLTLISLIEEAYNHNRLFDVKLEFQLLNKTIKFIKKCPQNYYEEKNKKTA